MEVEVGAKQRLVNSKYTIPSCKIGTFSQVERVFPACDSVLASFFPRGISYPTHFPSICCI